MPMSWTQIVDGTCKGTRVDTWAQSTMLTFLNLSSDQYSGMCAALSAMFLANPIWYLANRKLMSFKIDALNLFNSYKAKQQTSGMAADTFIKDHYFGFAWEKQMDVTPMSDGWPSKHMVVDGRYFLGISGSGGGHAMAVIVQKDSIRFTGLQKYLLLDPNDGVAGFDTWEGLNCALGWHLHDNYSGYTKYYITRWKF